MLTATPSQHIYAKCNDGFCNQFRMLLAGEFLVQEKLVQTYTQEWTTTNHNNVNFLDFFELPEYVHLKNIPQIKVNWSDGSFAGMTGKYIEKNGQKWGKNLRDTFSMLKLKPQIQQIVDKHQQNINSEKNLGIHVRRTCKIGVNKIFERHIKLLTNKQYLEIINDYKLNVYVSTDNRETQAFFKQNLKSQCITFQDINEGLENFCSENYKHSHVIRFTTPLHTIIDFYTLLNCKRFIGTESSSFSALIYHLRNNPNDFKIVGGV